jgi:autotransporter-associated beta strand protein
VVACGDTALFVAPLRSGTSTSNYVLALANTSITVGEINIDNAGWGNTFNVNVTTSGATLTFDSGSSASAKYIETAGTATSTTGLPNNCCRYTWNPIINVQTDWDINVDNVPFLNTGTRFTNLINGDSTKTITKNGGGSIQFEANLSLLPGEGFEGKYIINQGGVRLIGASAISKSTGITVNSGGQLQLSDNANTVIDEWSLASGAALKLAGTGKALVPGQPNLATIDGALRIGIFGPDTTHSGITTFKNPVELMADTHITVAAANTVGILDNIVSGAGALIKTGAGKLSLTANNTYAGNTEVRSNILSITNPYLADGADVYLTTGATFELNFSATDTIRSLYIDGVPQPTGTWGTTGSGADNESALITGAGLLDVSTQPVLGVPGDYNDNGVVDAGDYIVWRKGGPLENEVDNPGTVDAQDYVEWRARFGNPPGSGSSLGADAVPEPSSIIVAALAGLALLVSARRPRVDFVAR